MFLTVFMARFGTLLRKKESPSQEAGYLEYLVAGRRLTLPLFVATLVSTWYGGIFGVTQIAFEQGIYNFVTQGLFWYVTYLFFAWVLAPRLKATSAATLPEMVGELFGPRSRKLSAVLNFLGIMPIAYAMSAGIFLQSLFGMSLLTGSLLGVLFVVLYSFRGGLRAVVWAEAVQCVVMVLAVCMVPLFSWMKWGGWGFLTEHLPASHFDWKGGQSAWSTWVWGLIALGTLVDPSFYQRCFAAQDKKTAQRGILIATVIWVFFDLSTTLGGMYARAVLPQASSQEAYLLYVLELLPNGLRGFFLAGVLATVLSTLDSFLFVASSVVIHDLLPNKVGHRKVVRQGSLIAVGILAVGMVPLFDGSMKQIWLTMGSLSAGALFFPVLFGMLGKRKISDFQFVFTCLLSIVAMLLWKLLSAESNYAEVDPLYIGILVSAGSVLAWTYARRI